MRATPVCWWWSTASAATSSSTAEAYAQAWLHRRDGAAAAGDALTVNPYLGEDSLRPFLTACGDGSGIFVLTRTSNPGGADVQEAVLASGEPVWERIAALVARVGRGPDRRERPLRRRRRRRRDPARGRRARPRADAARHPAAARRRARRAARPTCCTAATAAHPAGGLIAPSRSVIYAWRDRGGDWRQGVRAAASELRRAALAV